MANKRVIDLPTLSEEVQEGQYILVDAAGGTGKMDLKGIVDEAGSFDPAGEYPELYAGNLTTDEAQTDITPYLFRHTGGNLSRIGERCYETIIGASVGENQLAYNGNFADGASGWGESNIPTRNIVVENGVAKITATEPTEYLQFVTNSSFYGKAEWISGHKYFVSVDWKSSVPTNSLWPVLYSGWTSLGQKSINTSGSTGRHEEFFLTPNANSSNNARFLFQVGGASFASGDYATIDNVMITDLTAELGSSIADYIYTLESATAGSGIAKLRSWGFLRGYQAYNAGSIESVEVTGKKVVGFNQWDEELEAGGINSSGVPYSDNSVIRTKNYIPILPQTTYCWGKSLYAEHSSEAIGILVRYYDKDKNFISAETTIYTNLGESNFIKTSPQNAYYAKFMLSAIYGTTYNHDICINLSSDRNGEYEPYTSQTYALGNDTLRGIFKLDANNNLYADGDRKTSDGTITRKYGVVDLGTLDWTVYSSSYPNTFRTDGLVNNKATTSGAFSGKYGITSSSVANMADQTMRGLESNLARWIIKDERYTDATAFKASLDGVMLVYELATPTTEISTPFTSPQICYPDGTEEFITENGVPVGHETEYPYDLKGLVEGLIDVPDVPSTNGTYVLKATRSASGVVYNWVTG